MTIMATVDKYNNCSTSMSHSIFCFSISTMITNILLFCLYKATELVFKYLN